MKFKIIFVSIILCISGVINAQNWFPNGAKWHVEKFCVGPQGSCGFYAFLVQKDTTFLGKHARIINCYDITDNGTQYDTTLVDLAKTIVYEDSNKVYFYENNQFRLLYDFSLNVADTLKFQVPTNVAYYYGCAAIIDTNLAYNTSYALVDSIGTYSAPPFTGKTMYFSTAPTDDSSFVLTTVNERIGSLNGFFGIPQITVCSGMFRCYRDDSISFSLTTDECDSFYNSVKSDLTNEITIVPNPAQDIVLIKSTTPLNRLELYNSLGAKVNDFSPYSSFQSRTINISSLPAGVYSIVAYSDQNRRQVKTIIKVQH